jgi:hypothetical protein
MAYFDEFSENQQREWHASVNFMKIGKGNGILW